MFSSIRKTLANAATRIAAAFTGKRPEVLIVDDVTEARKTNGVHPATLPSIAMPRMEFVGRRRARVPHSNRDARRKAGLPHGTSGAKLIRRAAQRRLTLRGQDVALYAA